MTRRTFAALLACLPFLAPKAPRRRPGMGLVYRDGPWPTHRMRVFVDGEDITHTWRVIAADDREGYVVRMVGGRGPYYINAKGDFPHEVVYGDVRIKTDPA